MRNRTWNVLFVIAALSLSGCITTYIDYPSPTERRNPDSRGDRTLYYQVRKFDILDAGGMKSLRKSMQEAPGFAHGEIATEPPAKGVYVDVETKWKRASIPAVIFAYISISTLALTPMWSTQDGYDINYHVYVDGTERKTYRYEITRIFGAWFFLLPFIWINLFTADESDAFAATTQQFYLDAAPILSAAP